MCLVNIRKGLLQWTAGRSGANGAVITVSSVDCNGSQYF